MSDGLLALLKAKDAERDAIAHARAITKKTYLQMVTEKQRSTFMHIAFYSEPCPRVARM